MEKLYCSILTDNIRKVTTLVVWCSSRNRRVSRWPVIKKINEALGSPRRRPRSGIIRLNNGHENTVNCLISSHYKKWLKFIFLISFVSYNFLLFGFFSFPLNSFLISIFTDFLDNYSLLFHSFLLSIFHLLQHCKKSSNETKLKAAKILIV